jgi:hypothetical protein
MGLKRRLGAMPMWATAAIVFVLVGLALTAIGAAITAGAVILTETQAAALSRTMWDENEELKKALLNQSQKAKWGLIIIVIGTLLQIAGTVPALIM